MIDIFKKIFKNKNEKFLIEANKIVKEVAKLEDSCSKLTDEECKNRILELKSNYNKTDVYLDKILPEVFAITREAAIRTLDKRHFDVQIIGGFALHKGNIAEMKTGEGKTLVATLAAVLNAISGKGVHIITVNDYLAERDYKWMSPLYNFLGLTTGCIINATDHEERKNEYNKDILHITNTEIGFDYLRDNMKFNIEDMAFSHKDLNFAIIDEVDSILIDESRTPLIISGPGLYEPKMYIEMNKIISKLSNEHYEIDEKHKTAQLTESGNVFVEDMLKRVRILDSNQDLYSVESYHLINYIIQSIKAHKLFTKNVDYIIKDGKVVLIDEFTGRLTEGRRYSEGLHQAIEAKENVKILAENQTLASITYQNFFRMYKKLSGMTGTAKTEASEFFDIYKLNVIEIPTQKKVKRKDMDDLIFTTEKEKNEAILKIAQECHQKGQPLLIGTTTIDKSEKIATLLKQNTLPFNILNAKHHEREAEIIAEAGRFNAITIATNMAGRGTDIKLGGNIDKIIEKIHAQNLPSEENDKLINEAIEKYEAEKQKVLEAGGLFVLGSERHESRRIDNQLRGRSGRQGDAGYSQFLLSLEDDLLRIFNGEKIQMILSKMGFKGGEAMNHSMLNKVIETSQKKVESFHYEIRKNLLKYDDITNEQRKFVYEQRMFFMKTQNSRNIVRSIINDLNVDALSKNDDNALHTLHFYYGLPTSYLSNIKNLNSIDDINEFFYQIYDNKILGIEFDTVSMIEKRILLVSLDESWREHLYELDHLKEGIHLRAYAQKDPFGEYKMESFALFEEMMNKFRMSVVRKIFHMEINSKDD